MSQNEDPPGFSSEGLFARAQAGDQAAWKEMYDKCYRKVKRVIERKLEQDRRLRADYGASDFASDVWMDLAANSHRFHFESMDALMAFLRRVAELKIIDGYRRQRAQKNPPVADRDGIEPQALASDDPTPSKIAVANEQWERILAGRTDEERKVIELRYLRFTPQEISERIGWDVRKVQRFLKDLGDSWMAPGGDR